MRTTSATYKSLRSESGSYYEVRVVVTDGDTYGHDTLKSVRISQVLTSGSGLSIGGTCASKCTLSLIESTDNWPRMAEFTVLIRLSSADGETKSEWLTMGTYYTDEREADRYGNLYITGYDAMLKTEQSWSDKIPTASMPANWPITAATAAGLVEIATGIQIDSRTVLDNTVAYIGLDTTTTARDMLAMIAAGTGGNWQITPDGKLRLIGFLDPLDEPTLAGLADSDVSIVGVNEWTNSLGEPVEPEYIYIGLSAKDITYGEELPAVTGVELDADDGTKSVAGTNVGYVVKGNCNFADNRYVASLCLSALADKTYRPFSLSSALLDPAAENGDMLVADGKVFQIGKIDWNLSSFVTAAVGSPYEEEVDHEYTVQTAAAKSLLKALKATDDLNTSLRSYIQQTAGEIMLAVESVQTQITDAVELSASAYEFVKGEGQTSYSPATITVSDTNTNRESQGTYTWYINGVIVSGQTNPSLSIANTDKPSNSNSIVVKCVYSTTGGNYTDEVSLVWLTGGQDGTNGTDGDSFAWNLIHNTMNPSLDNLPKINGYENGVIGFQGQTPSVAEHGVRIEVTSALRPYIRIGAGAANAGLHGLVPGKTYTLSFDAKWKVLSGTTNNTTYYMQASLYDNSANPDTIEADSRVNFATVARADKGTEMSARCEATFSIPLNATKLYFLIANSRTTNSNYASGDYIEVKNLMLQEGAKASPWSPAYADMVGENGASIASVVYGISASEDVQPTSWSSTVPSMAYGNWLWVKTTYTDGTVGITKSYSGTNGTNGTDGTDGYTVVLTNEYVEIPVDTNRKPLAVDSYVCQTRVYKGTTLLTPTKSTPGSGEYLVSGGTAPKGIAVSHNPAGTFTFSTVDDGGTITYNLIHNTVVPNLTDPAVYPSINGYNDADGERGYVSFSTGTQETAEHGVRITSTSAFRPRIRFGTDNLSHSGLYGLQAGETYTLSFEAAWKLLSGTADANTYHAVCELYTDAQESGVFNRDAQFQFGTIAPSDKGTVMAGTCEWTFTIPANATVMYIQVTCDKTTASHYASGDYIEMRNIMLNEGSSAAPWSPAESETQDDSTMEAINDSDEYDISITPYGLQTPLTAKVKFHANMNNQVVRNRSDITIQSNKIALVVEETAGGNVVNVASIVAAINDDESSVAISADKIQMTGTTTFLTPEDVGEGGSTVIYGGLIETGSITAEKLAVGSLVADAIASGYVYVGDGQSYIYSSLDQFGREQALRLYGYGGISLQSDDLSDIAINAAGKLQLISQYGLVQCQGTLYPSSNGSYDLGDSTHRWRTIYANSSNIVNSDRNIKKNIEALPEEYNTLFDLLRPVRYKMVNGTSGRFHTGMISQEVEDALKSAGLNALDFAGFCKDVVDGSPDMYSLRYEEFIALCIGQIQRLKAKNQELEERISRLEQKLLEGND